jgi:hypothetical protein
MKRAWAHQYATADLLHRADTDPEGVINELRAAPGTPPTITNRILQIEGTAQEPDLERGRRTAASSTRPGSTSSSRSGRISRNGRSDAELLALRADKGSAREMTEANRADNEAYLRKRASPRRRARSTSRTSSGPPARPRCSRPIRTSRSPTCSPTRSARRRPQQMIEANPRSSTASSPAACAVGRRQDGRLGAGRRLDLRCCGPTCASRSSRAPRASSCRSERTTFRASRRGRGHDRRGAAHRPWTKPIDAQRVHRQARRRGRARRPTAVPGEHAARPRRQARRGSIEGEQNALLKSYEPQPGEGFADAAKRQDALAKAIAQVRTARAKDPEFKARIEGSIAEAARTGKARIRSARRSSRRHLGKDDGTRAYNHYRASLRLGRDAQSVGDLSPPSRRAAQSYEPQPGARLRRHGQAPRGRSRRRSRGQQGEGRRSGAFAIKRLPASGEAYKAFSATLSNPTASEADRAGGRARLRHQGR